MDEILLTTVEPRRLGKSSRWKKSVDKLHQENQELHPSGFPEETGSMIQEDMEFP